MTRKTPRAAALIFILLPLICASSNAADSNQPDIKVIHSDASAGDIGSSPNFSGTVTVIGRFQGNSPAKAGGATVTFNAGARTAWHSHPLGQTLIVMSGHGFVQEEGKSAQVFGPGDVVWIPPGVKHWHGAGVKEPMTHVAIAERFDGLSVTWMEPVTDSQYQEAVRSHP